MSDKYIKFDDEKAPQMELPLPPGECRVRPTFVESDQQLKNVRFLQRKRSKLVLYYLSVILTLGVTYLLCRWLIKFKIWMMYVHVSELRDSTHFLLRNWDGLLEIVPKSQGEIYDSHVKEARTRTLFKNRHLNYVLYDEENACSAIEMLIWKPFDQIRQQFSRGLDQEAVGLMQSTYGPCHIDFQVPSYWELFLHEILHPFFIFQGFSVILWCVEHYYYYAVIIGCITLLSAVLNLKEIKSNLIKIRSMAFFTTTVDVYRIKDGEEVKITGVNSSELVPGDIISLTNEMKVPCDCIILQGQALLNECSLTGESIPVTKFAIPYNKEVYNPHFHKTFTVYEGTEVLQINENQGEVRALVIRTGFTSIRGQLIRGILYPKPHHFKFDREAYLFLLILACFTLAGSLISIPVIMHKVHTSVIVIRILDLVTITVPPSLPAALTVGISFALARLKKKNIFCISPPRAVVAGRIDTVCFDKTGTITFDEMDLKGVRLSHNAKFEEFVETEQNAQKFVNASVHNAIKVMGICHNVVLMGDHIVGDPMEVKLVHFSEFAYKASNDAAVLFAMKSVKLGNFIVSKKFEFNSNVQRMSVVAALALEPSKKFLFCKGAPEVVKTLSNPATLPNDFDSTLNHYTLSGYRVLALAYRELDQSECQIHLDDLDRAKTETNLRFVGFAVFQNKAKPESRPTIRVLNRAQIQSKMSTGDNPITAVSVAKDVAMISQTASVIICDLIEKFGSSHLQLITINEEAPQPEVLIAAPAIDSSNEPDTDTELMSALNNALYSFINELPKGAIYEIAFTGRAFSYLLAAREITDSKEFAKKVLDVVYRSKIFARMQPNHKIQLIEMLQKEKRLVAMVGDGANDVGALRTADVGLALSEAEASISAPFNSKLLNISSLIEVLREGRCTLATNFQCFKFMALYSMIQFTAVSILYTQLSNFNDMQFLWQDLCIIVPIFVTMSYTGPHEELSIDLPPDSLFSSSCLISVFGQISLQFLGQLALLFILKQRAFFVPAEKYRPDPLEFNFQAMENGTLFAFSSLLIIASIIAFSIGKPFRKPWYTNFPFSIAVILSFVALCGLFLWMAVGDRLFGVPETLPVDFRWIVILVGAVTSILMYCFERFISNGVGRTLERIKRAKELQMYQAEFPPQASFSNWQADAQNIEINDEISNNVELVNVRLAK